MEDRHDAAVVRENIVLSDAQLEVEDVEELALYPADIPLAEDTCAESPVYVLECGVIEVLERSSQRQVR